MSPHSILAHFVFFTSKPWLTKIYNSGYIESNLARSGTPPNQYHGTHTSVPWCLKLVVKLYHQPWVTKTHQGSKKKWRRRPIFPTILYVVLGKPPLVDQRHSPNLLGFSKTTNFQPKSPICIIIWTPNLSDGLTLQLEFQIPHKSLFSIFRQQVDASELLTCSIWISSHKIMALQRFEFTKRGVTPSPRPFS